MNDSRVRSLTTIRVPQEIRHLAIAYTFWPKECCRMGPDPTYSFRNGTCMHRWSDESKLYFRVLNTGIQCIVVCQFNKSIVALFRGLLYNIDRIESNRYRSTAQSITQPASPTSINQPSIETTSIKNKKSLTQSFPDYP